MSETVALSHGIPSSIREGEVLGGKYRLEKEIGRGAMGTVWSAVHLTLGQRVAIKLCQRVSQTASIRAAWRTWPNWRSAESQIRAGGNGRKLGLSAAGFG